MKTYLMRRLQSPQECYYCPSETVSFSCCRIVHTVLFDSWEIIGPYRAWWLLNGLLLLLQTLHIIWFYLIARIAIKAIFKGKVRTYLATPILVIRLFYSHN